MTKKKSASESATGVLSPAKTPKKDIEFINRTVDKKELNKLLSKVYEEFGTAKTGVLANNLKDLGFKFATYAGVTISIEDLEVPEGKKAMLADAEAQIEDSTQRFLKGEITEVERYTKVIDTWSETTENLTRLIVDNFNRMNPVYMMAFSGARGNISQVRQLVGMRGLMADAQGQIIDFPIKTNFREGLSVTEYIISSYGARKGLVDTALKTADSGYLTRRLVDVAQDVNIQELDCGTENGILMEAIIEGESEVHPLRDRIVSRTAAVNVVDADGEVLASAGEVIVPTVAEAIVKAGVKSLLVRSGLTCESQSGVCQKCYGWSLTTNKIVDLGEAIGIMAAQSIGEPGTQLTMRTFHTGGVFSRGANVETFKAKHEGEVSNKVPTREFRDRHGDIVQVTTKDATLEIKAKDSGKLDKYNLPQGAMLYKTEGNKVKAGELLAIYEPQAGRRTERATKDITADISGEICFEGFDADEKRDRQGNISRTATRAGMIWLLGGDVYTLPTGAKCLVKDGQALKEGEIIAETTIASEHGGEVRTPKNLETETVKIGKDTYEKVTEGKELTIIIASIAPENAELQQTKKEQVWKVNGKRESFVVKSPEGTTVENGSIVAELTNDTVKTPTSGEIRYLEVDVDEQRILKGPGKVLFLPEEIHQVSKDVSLKVPGIETGTKVKAGTEIVKGVSCQTAGIVELVEENDIIREVIVRPGELHRIDNIESLNVDDGTVVEKGVEIAPGIKTKEKCVVTVNFKIEEPDDDADDDDTSDLEYAEVLLRPYEEIELLPTEVNIKFAASDPNIDLVPVTQLQVKDGDKIRHIEGGSLLRTSLVLQMSGFLERMRGTAEIVTEGKGKNAATKLKIVVLENLTIRREVSADGADLQTSSQTMLLVKDGQTIEKRTPLVKTQVIATTKGTVSLGTAANSKSEKGENAEVRRVLIVTQQHEEKIPTKEKPSVKEGQFVTLGSNVAKGTPVPVSGRVVSADAKGLVVRVGRPYLIGNGTQLQVPDRALVQRSDLVASLIFEREKTGDIVQGLPRVEELLEGRKPKESALISPVAGTVEVKWEDDLPTVAIKSGKDKVEISLPVGANLIVEDKQEVRLGQALTDGPINPHDILEVCGIEEVRKYLVDEVQRVYRSQGVEIADKHLEIIVRQMTKKVRIDDGGDTPFLPGELADERLVLDANVLLATKGGKGKNKLLPATYHPVLLGITKASLNTDSFISAASFQETTRVLAEASVEGKKDYLHGLKENVIIGRLIPAGTGFPRFKDERSDMGMDDDSAFAAKSTLRKPSAILEEIESMFGAPEVGGEEDMNVLLDDMGLVADNVADNGDAAADEGDKDE